MFIERLTEDQIREFFDIGNEKIYSMYISENEKVMNIVFKRKDRLIWDGVSDTSVSAVGFYKTSEDWKFYLKAIFGEEYMKAYGEEPIEVQFIQKFTMDDLIKLFEKTGKVPESISEEEAFREGTKRFKVLIKKPNYDDIEDVVIGPHIDYCHGIPNLKEKDYMEYFVQRFGMDFIEYYIGVEKRKCAEKVMRYKESCDKDVKEKQNFLVKVWEKAEGGIA